MKLLTARRAAMCSLAILSAASQAAAEASAPEAGTTVPDVVVRGEPIDATIPSLLARYGFDVETLSRRQLLNSGVVDVAQAIELLTPGAFLATQAGPFSYANLSLQGSRNSDVLWTLDGVRINNRLYNSTSPSDTLPAAMVERVEVMKGGHGVLYGTQASAGVINVVTRPFSEALSGSVSVGIDTNDGAHLNGAISDSFGKHRFVAWASSDQSDGYEIFDVYQPHIDQKKRGYDVLSGGLKYGYAFRDDLSLTLQYIRTQAALDYPNANGVSVNDRDETIAMARIDLTPETGPQVLIKSYFHQWDTDYFTRPNPSAYWGYKDFGLSGLARFRTSWSEIDVGYDLQRYNGRDEVLLIDDQTEQVHAVFGQVRTSDGFSDRLRLSGGLRFNKAPGAETIVWSASGVYDFSQALFVEASGGTSFLLPDAEKLYGVDPCCTAGNPDLKPEESLNFNLSIGGRAGPRDGLDWRLTGYWRRVENLIATDTLGAPDGFDSIYVNIDGQTEVSGLEASLRGRLTPSLSAMAAYTYSREEAAQTGRQIAGRPRSTAKLALNWEPQSLPVGASALVKYVGDTETTVNGFGVRAFGNYAVVDLSGHWFVDGEARTTRLGLRLENALDEDYATTVTSAVVRGSAPAQRYMYRRLGMPRTAYLTLSRSF